MKPSPIQQQPNQVQQLTQSKQGNVEALNGKATPKAKHPSIFHVVTENPSKLGRVINSNLWVFLR